MIMENKIIYLTIRLFPLLLTFNDLTHLFAEYYNRTELSVFILLLLCISIIELLNLFPKAFINIISLKQRRNIQFGIHLCLVVHTIILNIIHARGWPTIIFTILVCGFYFFIVHKWVHNLQEEKIKIINQK